MNDKKFTDDQIIKSMNACVIGGCEGCVYASVDESGCRDALIIGLSNIIKRKDAQILELQGNLKFIRGTNKRLLDLCDEKDAEIERLTLEYAGFEASVKCFADIGKMYSEIRAEAIKEFAERLKEKRGLYGEIWESDIDKTVEELKGE